MAATGERAKVAPGTVSFELERFERTDGRLELSGRWFGVRGLRFVRPTLTLGRGDGSSSRALADLEHKPWAPYDGVAWQATFPCDDNFSILDAELAVSSGIVIPLPAPGEALPDEDPIAVLPPASELSPAPTSAGRRRKRDAQRSVVADELAALREETQRLRHEPIRLQSELDRAEQLRKDVEGELERLKLDADGALARRDAAVDRFEGAATERDDAAHERDDAVAERDEAVHARDASVRERDEATRSRDAVAAARDELVAERDEAVAERDAAMAKYEDAVAERAKALTERDKAVGERDRLLAERDAAVGARDKALADRGNALAERDRARSQRAASVSPRPLPLVGTGTHTFSEHRDQLIKRALAIAVLLVAGLALLIVLGVL